MSDAANEEKRRLLQQRKERLLTELQNVDAQLEECSTGKLALPESHLK